MEVKKLEYLDLEIKSSNKRTQTVENNIIKCNLEKHKLYSLFSKEPIQNSLIDLIINFSRNLELENKKKFIQIEIIKNNFIIIKESLDYIKNKKSSILEKITRMEKTPIKVDLLENIKNLDFNKPKEIEIEIKKLVKELKETTLS